MDEQTDAILSWLREVEAKILFRGQRQIRRRVEYILSLMPLEGRKRRAQAAMRLRHERELNTTIAQKIDRSKMRGLVIYGSLASWRRI